MYLSYIKRIKLIFLFLCISLFWSCHKKLFVDIEVQGRFIHANLKPDVGTNILLTYGDISKATQDEARKVTLCSDITDSNGSFKFKSNASTNGKYYLFAIVSGGYQNVPINNLPTFPVKENDITNLGDIVISWW